MPNHPQKLFAQFSNSIDDLLSIVDKVVSNSALSDEEKRKIVEGVFVQIVTCFESYTESLFFGLLEGKISRNSLHVSLDFSVSPTSAD